MKNGVTKTETALVLASDTKTLRGMLEASKASLQDVLPRHLTPDRLVKVALVAVSKTPLLQKCSAASILQCVMTAGQLGLDCGGVMGSASMIPFFSKKAGCYEATLIPGYRGLIDLARRSGQIDSIQAHVVYQDDEFDFTLGSDPKIIHRPNLNGDRSDDKVVAAYAVARLKDTTIPQIEVMARADIDKVMNSSRASGSGPWKDWYSEMARKTAIRRIVKQLPISIELAEALDMEVQSQARVSGDVIDMPALDAATSRADGLAARLKAQRENKAEAVTVEAKVEAPTAKGCHSCGKPSEPGELCDECAAIAVGEIPGGDGEEPKDPFGEAGF